VPPLSGVLPYVALGDGEVERDANGRHRKKARERWLNDEELFEPGTRDAFASLWDAMQLERDRLQDERLAEATSKD